jgi:hypothetical protein
VYQQRLSRLWPLLEYILEQENQREDQEQQDNDECGDSNAVGFVEFLPPRRKTKSHCFVIFRNPATKPAILIKIYMYIKYRRQFMSFVQVIMENQSIYKDVFGIAFVGLKSAFNILKALSFLFFLFFFCLVKKIQSAFECQKQKD